MQHLRLQRLQLIQLPRKRVQLGLDSPEPVFTRTVARVTLHGLVLGARSHTLANLLRLLWLFRPGLLRDWQRYQLPGMLCLCIASS